jgi:hypothetical protein
MGDNTGHRLLSAENRKAHPTIWCTTQICPGPMLKSSEITVQLNLSCSYSNTCIVNLFSGSLFKKTHTHSVVHMLHSTVWKRSGWWVSSVEGVTSNASYTVFQFCVGVCTTKTEQKFNYHYHYNHSTLMGIKQINTSHEEPLLNKQTLLKESTLLMKLLYPHLSPSTQLLYPHLSPPTQFPICSYTMLRTSLLGLTTSPWIVLWEGFKLLCNCFPTFHITNWWFWQQFSSISQEI